MILSWINFYSRKYDEIVSINDIPVTQSDLNLVKSLLDGGIAAPNMVSLKLPLSSTQLSNGRISQYTVDYEVPHTVDPSSRKGAYSEGILASAY